MGLSWYVELVVIFLLFTEADYAKGTDVEDKDDVEELCRRDILLIIDTSRTVGRRHFNTQVKPFLESFVTDKKLNVGPDGTQVSLMVFSEYSDPSSSNYRPRRDKTKVLIPFSARYNAEELKNYISKLDWKTVKGGHTRTDKALEIANTKIFPLPSPLNNRKFAEDVIVLITDGKPHGTRTSVADAIANAQKLKKKGVFIIGVGVGDQILQPKFWGILNDIATRGETLKAKFKNFQSIREILAKRACPKASNGVSGLRCVCPETRSAPVYLKPGAASTKITWKAPNPYCQGDSVPKIVKTIVQPPVTSPHTFGAGKHTVNYQFVLKGGQNFNCSVKFEVKACSCPPVNLDPVYIKPGEQKAKVTWPIPRPNCLEYRSPIAYHSLPIGPHSMEYTYNINNQYDLTCKVNIEVKGSLCKDRAFNPEEQECCCGVIHEKKSGFKCCGQDYYDTSKLHCCNGSNIRSKDEKCPNVGPVM